MEPAVLASIVAVVGSLGGAALGILGTHAIEVSRRGHERQMRNNDRRSDVYARLLRHGGEVVNPTNEGDVPKRFADLREFIAAYYEVDLVGSAPVREAAEPWLDAIHKSMGASTEEKERIHEEAQAIEKRLYGAMRDDLGII